MDFYRCLAMWPISDCISEAVPVSFSYFFSMLQIDLSFI